MLLLLSCFCCCHWCCCCCCCCCFGGGYWLPDTYCTCCQAKVLLPLPQRPLKPQTSVCLCISRCLIATRSFIKSESATRINLLPQFTPDWYLFGSYHLWKACTACCCLLPPRGRRTCLVLGRRWAVTWHLWIWFAIAQGAVFDRHLIEFLWALCGL